jgi:ribosomal protein S18 acetylase RimI-like enzyme
MDVQIRNAEPRDAASVVALVIELAANEGEPCHLTDAFVQQYLAFPGSAILLAKEGERALGLLSYSLRPNLYHAGSSCLIEELVVTAAARGQGIGGLLVSALLERLEGTDCEEVSVSTMADNLGAIKFYKNHGFIDEAVFLERHFA